MDDQQRKVWVEREWPVATGYVFLAEAVLLFGRELFPDTWQPTDPLAIPVPGMRPARSVGLSGELKQLAAMSDGEFEALIVADPTRVKRAFGHKEEAASDNAAADRLLAVLEFIRDIARQGHLRTGVRPVEGGSVTPLPPAAWETEQVIHRFWYCKLNPLDLYSLSPDGPRHQYIFVSEDDLAWSLHVLSSSSAKSGPDAPSEELSPPETRREKPGQGSPKHRSGGRPPTQRNSVIATLGKIFPDRVPHGDPQWTQEAIIAAVVERMGKNVSVATIKRAIRHLRDEQDKPEGA
jgi:hypothetical protein